MSAQPSRLLESPSPACYSSRLCAEYVAATRPATQANYQATLDAFEAICQPGRLRAISERSISQFAAGLGEGNATVVVLDHPESPRRIWLRIRGGIAERLRTLGPRQFAAYQEMLERVRSEDRSRTRLKVRQPWPRRKDHKPPKPPIILTINEEFKAKLIKSLQALGAGSS